MTALQLLPPLHPPARQRPRLFCSLPLTMPLLIRLIQLLTPLMMMMLLLLLPLLLL